MSVLDLVPAESAIFAPNLRSQKRLHPWARRGLKRIKVDCTISQRARRTYSLRGYGKPEVVSSRWKIGGFWGMPEESLIGMTLSAIGGLGCVGCAKGTILVILHAAKDGRSWEGVNVTSVFGPCDKKQVCGGCASVLSIRKSTVTLFTYCLILGKLKRFGAMEGHAIPLEPGGHVALFRLAHP